MSDFFNFIASDILGLRIFWYHFSVGGGVFGGVFGVFGVFGGVFGGVASGDGVFGAFSSGVAFGDTVNYHIRSRIPSFVDNKSFIDFVIS